MPSQFAAAGVTPQTLVWRKGIDQWTPAGELDELREYFHPQTDEVTQLTATPSPATTKPSAAPAHPTAQEATPSFAPSQPTSTPQANEIPNYLWLAVLSVVFMCSPIGIVAIHHAAKVDYYALRGNISEASEWIGSQMELYRPCHIFCVVPLPPFNLWRTDSLLPLQQLRICLLTKAHKQSHFFTH